jgi:hypothetical protein
LLAAVYFVTKITIPTIAVNATTTLYKTAIFRLYLSHKNPNITLLAKNPVPIITLYIPYAVPRNSDEMYLGITALCNVSEIPT